MVGSIVLASEVSLLLLVPTSMPPTQIKCAKEILRYPFGGWGAGGDQPSKGRVGQKPAVARNLNRTWMSASPCDHTKWTPVASSESSSHEWLVSGL